MAKIRFSSLSPYFGPTTGCVIFTQSFLLLTNKHMADEFVGNRLRSLKDEFQEAVKAEEQSEVKDEKVEKKPKRKKKDE